MELHECNHFCKCDFNGCNNKAKYTFSCGGNIRRDLCFCEECLKGMYNEISKMLVPKAIKSPFKINQRLRREDERRKDC